MSRMGLLMVVLSGCQGLATIDCEGECPTDTDPDHDSQETDTNDTPPVLDLGPPDHAATGFVHLFHAALAVAWTPTRGGAAWGGSNGGGDTEWPSPFGLWQLPRSAPRAVHQSGLSWACVASAEEVTCYGDTAIFWPTDWPQQGVVHGSLLCAVFEGGEVRCDPPATTPAVGPAARITVRDLDSGCILATDGTPTCWAAPGQDPPALPSTSRTWAELGVARRTACGIDPYGEAWCLLDGIDEPQSLGGRLPLTHLSVSHMAACAIDADHKPRCGDWDELPHPGIAGMPELSDVTAISVTQAALCVVRNADTVECWGGGTAVWRQPGDW